MPGSPLGFFTTKLFTAKAKFAVLREPFVPRRRDGKEESIAEFVQRRLGQEFLVHAIDALVAGVYAGDPYKLSVAQAFPKLAQLEARYGSLIKGQILGARERKKRGEVAKDRAAKFSFDDGLQVLPDTLAQRMGDALHQNASVVRVNHHRDGWVLDVRENGQTGQAEHSAVIYAGTAFKLAELEIETATDLKLSRLSEVRYPPVASVVLGFRREDVTHPCEGFGMLIPRAEGFKILGTIFSSSLFPNRAPAGHVALTSYIGGERYPELASLPPEKLFAVTCEDLRVLLGLRGKPVFQHSVFYPRAIPQYNVGYGQFRQLMTDAESKAPGLFLAGHYRDGVSLSDSIVSGCNVADRVEKYVQTVNHNTNAELGRAA
jgi:oxygen-dependent protoporphyrinogen oxidase